MSSSMAAHVLLILKRDEKNTDEFSYFIKKQNAEMAIEHELASGIIQAQNTKFDIIVLDAAVPEMPIEKTIQILRDIDPLMKIIVKSDKNSKEFEARIRNEKIYYFHLDSFGVDDLKLAVKSALQRRSMEKEMPTSQKNKSILMVDENDDFLEIHRTNLENHHFQVDICYDADEAFERIKKNSPALVMVDINIQVGSDGLHFLEKLVSCKEMRKIPILLFISKTQMSSYSMIMSKIKTTLPTWTYLTKPVKIENVIPAVEQLLN